MLHLVSGLSVLIILSSAATLSRKRNDFTNNFGYGPHGIGPSNVGVDSFGFFKEKSYNGGLPPLYTHASYRNYYGDISFHKNKYGLPAPMNFESSQQEGFGPDLHEQVSNHAYNPVDSEGEGSYIFVSDFFANTTYHSYGKLPSLPFPSQTKEKQTSSRIGCAAFIMRKRVKPMDSAAQTTLCLVLNHLHSAGDLSRQITLLCCEPEVNVAFTQNN
ncbi:hypothetical protein TELCIR_03446 [Teladorsagia circumcincta]|uniref:Uncharacterized protein n=1 Tax=Teladorsagia circumcincta TaxID=45464 RepID=A0A2G9UYH0_TELCI|nr:hypothetical protein TELCIR_03446 [Teladorsagia circumcincta]